MAECIKQVEMCVVMLVGLPGSGKTTLCNTVKNFLETPNSMFDNVVNHVIPVCYDEKIPIDTWQGDSLCWKNERKTILKYVSLLLRCLKGLDTHDGFDSCTKETLLSVRNCLGHCRVFVIIDDNMYYRSMRYEYYQLARLYSLSFCQIYIETSVADALSRNSSRDPKAAVPESVIVRMSEKLEPPNIYSSWEKMSLEVASASLTSEMTNIYQFLINAVLCSVIPIQDNSEMRAQSRAICSASVAHQVDVMLRRLVGERMKCIRQSGLSSQQLETWSKLLADVRRHIMDGIKVGRIEVPEKVEQAIEQQQADAGSELKCFLDNLFDLHQL